MKFSPKILFVNVSDSFGGASRAAIRILEAINLNGGENKLLVKYKSNDEINVIPVSFFVNQIFILKFYRFIQNKIKNKIQQYNWKRYPQKENVFLSDLRSQSIGNAFNKLDFEILHLHWINLRFLNLKELQKINKPIVWTLHDCWPFTGICHYSLDCQKYELECKGCPYLASNDEHDLSNKIFKKKLKYLSNLNLHIVSPSNWLGNSARKSKMFSLYPVTVIPNPINSDVFRVLEKDNCKDFLKLDLNTKYLLFGAVNSINDSRKGFNELIKALRIFEQCSNPDNIQYLVFGNDSNPINNYGLKNQLNFLGSIKSDDKLMKLYNSASLTIVPSLEENLSNTIMESLSCGTPVVAFNIGGNSDMIDHRVNGYLAKPFDVDDLAFGINWVINNNINNLLSINSREKVINNFTYEIVAKKYLSLYKEILD